MIEQAASKLLEKLNLSKEEMYSAMEEIMSGKVSCEQIVSFLVALAQKGENVQELAAAVSVMRNHARKITLKDKIILDTCGTGGDNLKTFNISTVVAFVVSGCGITVAKHGNRSISSQSGSADTLEAAGININLPLERIEEALRKIGIAFLFAPNFHPATKYAMEARKKIGKRTIFNLLGPLTNPADATHQLVGVYDKKLTHIVAGALADLGTKHALVVHGDDGLDEISTTGTTFIAEAKNGKTKNFEVSPEDFGFRRANLKDLEGKGPGYNARLMLDILKGAQGPCRDIVELNAAFAIYAADKVKDAWDGLKLARQSIDSKNALEKFEQLKKYSLA